MQKTIKQILIVITPVLLFFGCGKKEAAKPCYVGTFQSPEYYCGNTKKSSTITLNTDGTGQFLDPQCDTRGELLVKFTYAPSADANFYTIVTTSVASAGKIVPKESWGTYRSLYSFLGVLNGKDDIPILCVSTNITINDDIIESHVSGNLWKRI